ncbi:hypothetical protein D778_01372 [Xanthomarina gelatinilytica]|uniref:Uncharacterized protein n=1 Tax=Xanthomarina gelatinilytica TaxID=1137281 RepID=M7N637_9FLAO|nr:hypothetical protein D778_01372 [Xanthomarina gelatinilytica]
MRIQFIILILITNFAFGQRKVSIDKNVLTYEKSDEYERFDNVDKTRDDFKELTINIENSILKIENSYSGGFIGYDIVFEIDKELTLKETSYHYWTDNIDLENPTDYIVTKAKIILNQNPFKRLSGLRGIYELEIDHLQKNQKVRTETFKGKFKTYSGIKESSPEYIWALNQNQVEKNIRTENGVYLNPDTPPSLKSDTKELIEAIKKIEGSKPSKLIVQAIINENGKIEKETIRFRGEMSEELKNKIADLLTRMTDWNPACVNEIQVKSKIPIIIGIE